MKKIFVICYLLVVTAAFAQTGNTGIGTLTPHASARLDITDTIKGILIPRMSAARRSAIASPATGLQVYQTDGTPGFYYYDGTAWLTITSSGPVGGNGIINTAIVTTIAGNGTQGSSIDGNALTASFNYPHDVATDPAGNVYVADAYNNKIRKITPAGVVTTFAGSGIAGSANGTGTAAYFNFPADVATDAAGNVYVGDDFNYKIRKITPGGVVTTLAGSGSIGSADGIGSAASFFSVYGIATDVTGNVYVADWNNHKIRKILQSNAVYATVASLTNYATIYSLSNYATNATLSGYVSKTGADTINGVKTFSANLIATGNVVIGTAAPTSKLSVNGGTGDAFTIFNGGDTRLMNDDSTGSASFSAVGGSGVDNSVFTLKSAGITYNFTAGGLTTTSDMRLKQDVALLGNSLQKIMQLNGYSYRYKNNTAQPNR